MPRERRECSPQPSACGKSRVPGQVADSVVARPQVHRLTRDVLTIDDDLARVRRRETDNHVKRCGLPGTIGAQQSDYFSLIYVKANAIDYPATTVGLCDVIGRERLHLLGYSCGGNSTGISPAFYEDFIIATIEGQ